MARTSVDIQNKVTQSFIDEGVGYWHYISDIWLFTSEDDEKNCKYWFDKVEKIVDDNDVQIFVMQIEPKSYYGHLNGEGHDWLKNHWHFVID